MQQIEMGLTPNIDRNSASCSSRPTPKPKPKSRPRRYLRIEELNDTQTATSNKCQNESSPNTTIITSQHRLQTLTKLMVMFSALLVCQCDYISTAQASEVVPEAFEAPQASASTTASSSSPPSSTSTQTSTLDSAGSCFGGLQIFEKISMSTFEGAQSDSGSSSFSSGVLIQQDDQALTSECLNICRSQANCLSFVIDYSKFECKSYATTQQELQHELDKQQQQGSASTAPVSGVVSTNGKRDTNSSSSQGLHNLETMASSTSSHSSQLLLPSASSNYFEKVCLEGIAGSRQQLADICGQGRLWLVERVVDAYLDGYVEKEVTNVQNKDECSKLCLFESDFVCRSADFDLSARICRLSKEDRRSQPQAMRVSGSGGSRRHYIENQCASMGPSSCVYEQRKNVGIISMDALKFAQTLHDCEAKCNQEVTFNCRSYAYYQQRCFLSGDDSTSLSSHLIKLPTKVGWQFGEKKCLVELCTKGIFSYEKITGFGLRSALATPVDLMLTGASSVSLESTLDGSGDPRSPYEAFLGAASRSNASLVAAMMAAMADETLEEAAGSPVGSRSAPSGAPTTNNNLAITTSCRKSCDLGYLNCPAFSVDYKNNRCQRLDRNSQGRHHELVAREGFSYYEKICLRVPEMMSMCQDKFWIFERVLGFELAPHLYDKSLKFVQSRRDCEEYCLEEKSFQCRSALYNDETSDCKLSRLDRRLAANSNNGYYRNFNSKISYLENQCVRDQVSVAADKRIECVYDKSARDEPSYPTFTERIEMLPQTGSGSQSMRLTMTANESSVEQCKQLCNDNANFQCRSFGFYGSTAQCFLSGDDTTSAGETAASPSSGFAYYEKRCRLVEPATPYGESMSPTGGRPNGLPAGATPADMSSMNPYLQPPTTSRSNFTASNADTMTTPSSHHHEHEIESSQPEVPGSWPTTQTSPQSPQAHRTTHAPTPASTGPINHELPAANSTSTITSSGPNAYKCGQGHSFVYQRVSGFEPIGGYLSLLIRNNEAPGIVADCADLCKRAYECRAFVVDYQANQCYAMLENSSVGLLSLRQSLGKDYFEGFCVSDHLLTGNYLQTSSSCSKRLWLVDKIVDQAVVGVQHQRLLMNVDRVQCRLACIEERVFYCKSAMFDSTSGECKLYSIDRESWPQMRLQFTRGVDFFENQCQISSSACPYDAIERDMQMLSTIKSVQVRSTFECELECNMEGSFNCRSYSYVETNPSLPNLCLLSSDSRSTSQKGSIRGHPKSLFAERNCYYRRPRYPGGDSTISGHSTSAPLGGSYYPAGGSAHPELEGGPSEGGELDLAPPSSTPDDVVLHGPPEPNGGMIAGQLNCEPHQYTFERTFGFDFRSARRERAPIAPTLAIASACQQECIRRDRCQSFVVDYALPFQACFLLESQVGANRHLLSRAPASAYFEKICLPRTSTAVAQQDPLTPKPSIERPTSHLPTMLGGYLAAGDSNLGLPAADSEGDIAPSYSSEPWRPQSPAASSPQYSFAAAPAPAPEPQAHNPSSPCAKLWAFERFVAHNFTAPSDRQLASVLSRSQCEAACLNEASFTCRAGTYDYALKLCRLFRENRRSLQSQFVSLDGPQVVQSSPNVTPKMVKQLAAAQLQMDYFENTCVPEPSSCQYRVMYDLYSRFVDRQAHSVSLSDCQRQCDLERLFSCKSINYDPITKSCLLINEDLISLDSSSSSLSSTHSTIATSPLIPKKNSIYSEKSNCELVSVQCTSHEMLVSINFDTPFRGRIMAKGNPEQCQMVGDGQTSVHFPIPFGPKCNSRQEGHNTFVNELVVQQHPIIMTDSDKTVRVMCAFEAPDQTITLKNPSSLDNRSVGIDVGAQPESSRIRNNNQNNPNNPFDRPQFQSIVSSKASPPSVVLRILDANQRDASTINLGDDLTLRIQMQSPATSETINQKNSALGIFARNLLARSSGGESLLLIDNAGCPVDSRVFPSLEVDPKDGKSLQAPFKAFRFPSSGLVNFEVQIKFCPERCPPVDCHTHNQSQSQAQPNKPMLAPSTGSSSKLRSYGRRRRRRRQVDSVSDSSDSTYQMSQFRPVIQSHDDSQPSHNNNNNNDNSQAPISSSMKLREPISTVMKPGKAFQFVRDLMLPKPANGNIEDDFGHNNNNNQDKTTNDVQEANIDDNNQRFAAQNEPQLPAATEEPQPDRSISIPAEAELDTDAGHNRDGPAADETEEPLRTPNNKPSVQSQAPYGHFPNADPHYATHLGYPPDNGALQFNHNKDPFFSDHNGLQSDTSQMHPKTPSSGNNPQDLPLKFSILVGDNNQADQGINKHKHQNSKPPTVEPPALGSGAMLSNLDHIVIPGKDGQLDVDGTSELDSKRLARPTMFDDSQQQQQSPSNGHNDKLGGNALGKLDQAESSQAESTSDASKTSLGEASLAPQMQPVSSNPTSPASVDTHTSPFRHNELHRPIRKALASNVATETLASQDCQTETERRSKLWTIIWTATFIFVINLCLVIIILFMYFKRINSSKNHNFVVASRRRGANSIPTPSLSAATSSGYRWPSVLLKNHNKDRNNNRDQPTSLTAHEQFFYKLNPAIEGQELILHNNSNNNLSRDLQHNWNTNTTKSSRSSLSSQMTNPLASVTSIRINQTHQEPSLPFEFQASQLKRNNQRLATKGLLDLDPTNKDNQGNYNEAYSPTHLTTANNKHDIRY